MNIKKYFYVVLIFPFFILQTYGADVIFTEDNSMNYKVDIWETKGSSGGYQFHELVNNLERESLSSGSIYPFFYTLLPNVELRQLIFYTLNNEDYVIYSNAVDVSITNSNVNFEFSKYKHLFNGVAPNHLNTNLCYSNIGMSSGNIYLDTNLQPFPLVDQDAPWTSWTLKPATWPTSENAYFESLFKKNYYMKTLVVMYAEQTHDVNNMTLSLADRNYEYIFPEDTQGEYVYNKYNYNTISGSTTNTQLEFNLNPTLVNKMTSDTGGKYPYILGKPSPVQIDFERAKLKHKIQRACFRNIQNCGTYQLKMDAIPIDGKCDMDTSGTLENTEAALFTYPSTVSKEIKPINPDLNKNLIEYDPTTGTLKYVDNDGTETTISTPTSAIPKKIKIYKEGILEREEDINPKIIANIGHNIKLFKNKQEAKNFVTNTYQLMNKFDISKELFYDSIDNKTHVRINLRNIPETERKNLTLYQMIPKWVAQNLSKINILNNGRGQFFVKDKDPIIGWYFNESAGDESIEYEVPGDTEGGEIVVTQEPILYNEGELIINYRQSDCNPGEVELFRLDDIENSNVYAPGTPGISYKVCMAHISTDLYGGAIYPNNIFIMAYNQGENASANNLSTFNQYVTASAQENNIFWDVRLQETNPTGNYSCIGSVNDYNNSLFGDCGYTNNRIWVHLGEDLIPPTTLLTTSRPANSMRVKLNSTDNIGGSGLDKIYYCVDDTNTCTPTNVIDNLKNIVVSCDNHWSCIKFIRYYATDLNGNAETVKSYKLMLLDKYSSCQADCTAKPSPNRFMKECNNLNGCTYLNIGNDEGKTMAEKCDLLLPDSYVDYNSTHQVLCPNGPFRKKKYTTEKIDIKSNVCEDYATFNYPVIVDSENMMMKLVVCIN